MDASTSVNFDIDFFNKYTMLPYYISKGSSGIVYGPIQLNNMQLAIKQVLFANSKSLIEEDLVIKQKIWTSLEHEHLTRIYSVDLSQLPKVMYIVMEFAGGDSLNRTLRALGSENHLPIDAVTDWVKQIAEGMLYLHLRNIVHRDLKSSNILLMEPFDVNNPHKRMTLKITDFDDVKEFDHTTTMSFVGTCAYMAPEVLLNERFTKASDVWSFGVLIWETLSKDVPHKGLQPSEMIAKTLKGELNGLLIPPSFPEYYKFILEKCWKSTCEERCSFQQILDVLDPDSELDEGDQRHLVDVDCLRDKCNIRLIVSVDGGGWPTKDDVTTRIRNPSEVPSDRITNDLPDIMGLDDDNPRVKMVCGHAIAPSSLVFHCYNKLEEGEHVIQCPAHDCNKVWSFASIVDAARLSPDETREFELRMISNKLNQSAVTKECPRCGNACRLANEYDERVRCKKCTSDGGTNFDFCWSCLKEWKTHKKALFCGNHECRVYPLIFDCLENCTDIQLNGIECPSRRACPSCYVVIEYTKNCKHMKCPNRGCKYDFCFICLDHYPCKDPCSVAPRQREITQPPPLPPSKCSIQ